MDRVRSISLRMSIGAVIPLVAALAAQAGYTLISQRSAMETGLENKAEALAALMVKVVGPSLAFDDTKGVVGDLDFIASDTEFGFAAAVGADGSIVGFHGDQAIRSQISETLVSVDQATTMHVGHLLVAATPVVTDGKQVGTVIVGLRTDDVRDEVAHMSAWAAGISFVGLLVAVLVVRMLAGKVARRNHQMRVVLDNVDEALVTIHRDGTLAPECSAAFERWFGLPGKDQFATHIARGDRRLDAALTLAWSEIVEGVMPLEVLVDQFPSQMDRDGRHFRLDIKPLLERDKLVGALLRIRDVTDAVDAQRTLEIQREYVSVFENALADPHGVREFVEDTGKLVDLARSGSTAAVERKRAVHTIKGNAAIYGVDSVVKVAHRLEENMTGDDKRDAASMDDLVAVWTEFADRVERLLGRACDTIEVPRDHIEKLVQLAETTGSAAAEPLRQLLLEPVAVRYDAFRRQIERLATKLGKLTPTVVTAAADVRTPPEQLRPFWNAFAHVIRNSLDHGIEDADERRAVGKSDAGTIELRAWLAGKDTCIEFVDDGRGIDWDRVRAKAVVAGIPAITRPDLERALFSDGLSTAEAVSETSGRGIGLAAVHAAVSNVGGRIAIASELGTGTRFTFTFPDISGARTTAGDPAVPGDPGRVVLRSV